MRWLERSVLAVALAGCGRLGFGVLPDPDADGLRSVCSVGKVTIVENGLPTDDAVGATLASTLATGCGIAPSVRNVSQDDPGILDDNGRPLLAPDDLAVVGGGDGPNRSIAYLLANDTPVTWVGSTDVTFRERATERVLVTASTSASHDFALVMLIREPIGGCRVLSASGMTTNGSIAAGYWFATQIAPAIVTIDDTWTLVEWTDADGEPAPSDGDLFTVIASGR